MRATSAAQEQEQVQVQEQVLVPKEVAVAETAPVVELEDQETLGVEEARDRGGGK